MLADYCQQLGFADNAAGFASHLCDWLTDTATEVDAGFPDNKSPGVDESGQPVLKRNTPREPKACARALESALLQCLPERNVIDMLCDVAHWTSWNQHFGPLSGSDPKIENLAVNPNCHATKIEFEDRRNPLDALQHAGRKRRQQ